MGRDMGASPDGDRACAPSGLSRDASQAEPLVPSAEDSFEVFKLRGLLDRADAHDAKIIHDAIRHMQELEHQVARDDELWRGVTVRRAGK